MVGKTGKCERQCGEPRIFRLGWAHPRQLRKSTPARPIKNILYDSYIRAIRWASDRIGDSGVIGFVTNAGWMDGNAMDGMRKVSDAEEFSSLYVFHLRGNQRTQGERSRQEGGKVFGSGSRAPVAITIFVKNPKATEHGRILFHDIGDYLDREAKLEAVRQFGQHSRHNGGRRLDSDNAGREA